MDTFDKMFQLDEICSRFEQAWAEAGEPPDLYAFVSEVDEGRREEVFRLLFPLDIEHRKQHSLEFGAAHYLQQFPNYGSVIDEVMSPSETVSLNEDSSIPAEPIRCAETTAVYEQPTTNSVADSQPSTPKRIGRYTILQKLDRGGQGNVYRAAHPTLPIEVALKVGHRQFDASARRALVNEARVLCDLDHPNIAKVRDLEFDQQGHPIMVLEFVRGRSLNRLLQDKAASLKETIGWLADAADAVGYAHRRGVLHLDLKPANIMISEDGTAKVIDFGLARLRDAWNDSESEADGVAGTPEYMPPEQAKGDADQITSRSDVFAIGAVLYRVLTGSPPFRAESAQKAVLRARHYELDLESLENASAPRSLAKVCRRAVAKDPSERFATAEGLSKSLRSSRRPYRSFLAVGVAFLAVVVVVMLSAFGLLESDAPNSASEASIAPTADKNLPSQPLNGELTLAVVRDGKLLPVEDPRARPVRPGDGIRIEAELNQTAFLYLIWIDETGTAKPFYPGRPGDWKELAASTQMVKSLVLPELESGYEVTGESGMQTIVLLARNSPLPETYDLSGSFSQLPYQTYENEDESFVILGSSRQSINPLRAADFSSRVKADIPVMQTHQELLKLREDFPLVRAVSIALKSD